jgi:hypothetical protein
MSGALLRSLVLCFGAPALCVSAYVCVHVCACVRSNFECVEGAPAVSLRGVPFYAVKEKANTQVSMRACLPPLSLPSPSLAIPPLFFGTMQAPSPPPPIPEDAPTLGPQSVGVMAILWLFVP